MKIKKLITEKSSKSRDPYVLYLNNKYYYCFSRDDKIYLCVANNLDDLDFAEEIVVYENKEDLKELWAPELHVINNECYIYVAADDGINENHRMYVLANNSSNPLDMYTNRGIISDSSNKWAIDGTIFNYQGQLYFIWSGCDGSIYHKQEIFIARMQNPYQISSEKVKISTPIYEWEKCGGDGVHLAFINEGPAILEYNDKVYLVYSASGCWCGEYCLGLLELVHDNPLDINSWKKYRKPVFKSYDNIIGPGHCSFVHNAGTVYMFFHAFLQKDNCDLANVNAYYLKYE